MNLREQLRLLLHEILPHDPADSIKGTELIRLVRLRLGDGYSDATLRYHFSILSYDPTSPIAKVDQGQGYYQRQKKTFSGSNGVSRQGLFDSEIGENEIILVVDVGSLIDGFGGAARDSRRERGRESIQ